jgi:hypothetical protein
MYSVPGDTTSLVPGFPIRTSSDHRSVDSSPRHIAASHVLHRLPVPRHPPCALKHLQHKTKKMSHHPHTPRTPERAQNLCGYQKNLHYIPNTQHHKHCAFRCSQPLSTNQTPHPTTKAGATTRPPNPQETPGTQRPATESSNEDPSRGLVVSKPNSVSDDFPSPVSHQVRTNVCCCTRPQPTTGRGHPTNRLNHRTPTICGRAQVSWCSLERR